MDNVRLKNLKDTLRMDKDGNPERAFRSCRDADGPTHVRRILGRRYFLEAKVGEGAINDVYRARDWNTGRIVAVKTLLIESGYRRIPEDTRGRIRPMEREIKALSRLDHENIVRLLDNGIVDDGRFLVMEYLEGAQMDTMIGDGGVPLERALSWLLQLCDALQAMHASGVVHTDIKPQNVCIQSRADGTEIVKVFDFGHAKFLDKDGDPDRNPEPGIVLGTWLYMAPEQLTGNELDRRTDIYSFGALAYHLLCGMEPFETVGMELFTRLGGPPSPLKEIKPEIPDDISNAVTRALQVDPADRFQTAEEMRKAIEASA